MTGAPTPQAARKFAAIRLGDVRNVGRGGAILDEIQRAPELTSYLQGMVDDDPRPGRLVLTGSQPFERMRAMSLSLAGRTAILRLLPFAAAEVLRASLQARRREPANGQYCITVG